MGRPSNLPKARVEILANIRAGMHPAQAARAAGVPESTFNGWMRDPRPACERFRSEIEEAEAQAEAEVVSEVRRTDPRWWLERRHRDRWGKPAEATAQAATIVTVEPAAAPELTGKVIELSPDQLRALSHEFLNRKRIAQGLAPFDEKDEERMRGLIVGDYSPEHPAEE